MDTRLHLVDDRSEAAKNIQVKIDRPATNVATT